MIRLDRLLSSLAMGSRQEVRALLRMGRVEVNGMPARDPAMKLCPESAVIRVDGVPLDTRLTRHVMMHKPSGVLTAARDENQPTVQDLLPPLYTSLQCMPVGRLDKDTEGLLLFTTDGSAAHRLLSPRHGVDKVYLARVSGRLTQASVKRFECGISLKDFTALPAGLKILQAGEKESLAEVRVEEGKFHQVKRMFSACGHEVTYLKRLRIGNLPLDPALAPGQWRELSPQEWQRVFEVPDERI